MYLALNPDAVVDQDEWNLFLNAANLVWARRDGAEVVCNAPMTGIDVLSPAEAALNELAGGVPDAKTGAGAGIGTDPSGTVAPEGAARDAAACATEPVGALAGETADAPGHGEVSGRWAEVIGEFGKDEEDVVFALQDLAKRGITAPDGEVGRQIGDVASEVSWPSLRIALLYDLEAGVEPPTGWTVFTLDDAQTGNIPEQLVRTTDGK